MKFLITAGGTREYIDPVRYITNASSGKMGNCLAKSALEKGNEVCLVTAADANEISGKAEVLNVVSAADMFGRVKEKFDECDCLIMAAAVSDYTVKDISESKIKKSDEEITLKLKPTEDILKWAGKNKRGQFIVGFALEDSNLLESAEKKMNEKNADMIVANSPSAIGAEKTGVFIKTAKNSWQEIKNAEKQMIADRIIQIIEEMT